MAQCLAVAYFQKYFTSVVHGVRERGIRCLFNFDFLAVLGHFQAPAAAEAGPLDEIKSIFTAKTIAAGY